MPTLEFSQVHSYASTAVGISLPVVLKSGGEVIDLLGVSRHWSEQLPLRANGYPESTNARLPEALARYDGFAS